MDTIFKIANRKICCTRNTELLFFAFILIITINIVKAQQIGSYKFLIEKIELIDEPPATSKTEFLYNIDNRLVKIIGTSHFFEQGQWRDGKSVVLFEYENGLVSKKMYYDSTHFLCHSCDDHYFYNSQGQLIRHEYYVNGVYYNKHTNFHYHKGLMVSTYNDYHNPFDADSIFYDNYGNVVKRKVRGPMGPNDWRVLQYKYDNNPRPSYGMDYLFLNPPPPAQGTSYGPLAVGLSKNNMTKDIYDYYQFNYTYNEFGLPETIQSIYEPTGGSSIIHISYKQVEVGILEQGQELLDIKVFPNPTKCQLTIDHGQLTINSVEVFDIYGRNILDLNKTTPLISHSSFLTIDISHLHSGIYMVKIATENGIAVKKIIKQ